MQIIYYFEGRMFRDGLLLIFLALLQPLLVLSQQTGIPIAHSQSPADGTPLDYSRVDSHAVKIKYKNDLRVLTKELTSPFPDDMSKSRAIFRWITENIQYDYKYYNRFYYRGRFPKAYKCRNDEQCKTREIAWEIKYVDKVLRKRKAVCLGYAMLFKKMCELAGIQSEIVTGSVRTEYYQVGAAGSGEHAWNVVWLDSSYYLLDPTWASGGCSRDEDGKLTDFFKDFDEYYWLTPPSDFARSHFPQEAKWALLPGYAGDNFAANPYYLSSQLSNLKLIAPHSGLITAKLGDTIRFKLEYPGKIQHLQINSNDFRNPYIWTWENVSSRKKLRVQDSTALKKQQYIRYQRSGNVYEFTYVVTSKSLYYLDLIFDTKRVMRFRIKVEEEENAAQPNVVSPI